VASRCPSRRPVNAADRNLPHGEPKWLWFLQIEPAPPPNSGMADTLEEAKAAFKQRYAEVKGAT
jgi:hypothetical protein